MDEEKRIARPDEMYCRSCGAIIKKDAEICVHCGVRAQRAVGFTPKDKTVAVLLAVFLSFWTWLYTYKKDAWKFWLGLGLNLVGWAVLFIPNFAIWIWAIVDVAVKPKEFYESY
jgi:TM2 domain-containing membrane protein YozV